MYNKFVILNVVYLNKIKNKAETKQPGRRATVLCSVYSLAITFYHVIFSGKKEWRPMEAPILQ